MASPSQPGNISTPADVLTSLVTSIEDLRKETTQLRRENSVKATNDEATTFIIENLKNELAQLQQKHTSDQIAIDALKGEVEALRPKSQGRVFTLFPKLPKEIRLLIWDTILWTPQIIAVHRYCAKKTYPVASVNVVGQWEEHYVLPNGTSFPYRFVPNGPHAPPRQVSREARGQALAINTCDTVRISQDSPGLFAHPEIDILWWHDFTLPRYGSIYTRRDGGPDTCSRTLAIPWEVMVARPLYHISIHTMRYSHDDSYFLSFLRGLGVRDLVVVLNGADIRSTCQVGITFAAPKELLWKFFDKESAETNGIHTDDYDWSSMAAQRRGHWVNFLNEHVEYAKAKGILVASLEQWIEEEQDDMIWDYLKNLWEVPNITFREVILD